MFFVFVNLTVLELNSGSTKLGVQVDYNKYIYLGVLFFNTDKDIMDSLHKIITEKYT